MREGIVASTGRKLLVGVLQNSRRLLALPGNDFCWSIWADAGQALREIDGYIDKVKTGAEFSKSGLEMLFAPTGPVQEVSVSSGWGREFLALASRFDFAVRWI